jgi:pyruvate,water dikinase
MALRAKILNLDEIVGEPVGGKAAGLARLRGFGLRVPEAVVVVGATSGISESDLDRLVAALTERFGVAKLAVRSSAMGEDGAEASFAGQYDTVLDVEGPTDLAAALRTCWESADSDRASAYRGVQELRESGEVPSGSVEMSVVVQRMVNARASGVCFTVDPVTHRRNRLVLDSVSGLGEALVSGHASADHDELLREQKRWEPTQLAGEKAHLASSEREKLGREALEAEAKSGEPLDLEWAIDQDGTLYWLQARPVTTLELDPQALDVLPDFADDVCTRCNVGEMMPGAISPLTYSTCARGIDVGWQGIKESIGIPRPAGPPARYLAMSHGHLFINLSEGARFSSTVSGGNPDQQNLAICGRLVPEVVTPDPTPFWVRLPRLLRQLISILRPKPRIRRMEALLSRGPILMGTSSLATWQNIDARIGELFESYQLHLVVSSGAGALAPILLGRLAGGGEPTDQHHAIVASVLAGAENVESADIAEGAERILRALLAAPDHSASFADLDDERAVEWLSDEGAGEVGRLWRTYLKRHGHRSLRELDIRQPEWRHDPTPVVRSLQSQVRGRLATGTTAVAARSVALPRPAGAERFDRIRGLAHAAVRNRERAKSLLVGLTAEFKAAYRGLAKQLVEEGRLSDPDSVYFLFHEELEEIASAASGHPLKRAATQRREVLAYQETLQFPDVGVGLPQPEPLAIISTNERTVVGKPVSRGRVEGLVRVVLTLDEAEALEPGEILVAPITDVGWTPYFAIIGGLVTDVGSAVSHGAVVAREFGLPAVLNTRDGTRILRTGERVVLDGDRGTVERLDVDVESDV